MEDYIYYGNLFNIYKDLLSNKEKLYYSLYYEENLTLQEIGDNYNVSKSYVGNVINKTSKKLINYENILNIYKQKEILTNILDIDNIDEIKKIIKDIL